MKFFFDRNISVHLARMLAHFDRENSIRHQDDDARFDQYSEDVYIIETLAAETPKPVWITADISQKRVPVERAALAASEMTIFFFKRFHTGIHEQALKIIAIWPSIIEEARRVRVPTAFEIPSGPILGKKIDSLGPTAKLFK